MILKSYSFENWGPHKKGDIVFPEGSKTIAICGENDQGKSWIVRGIAFCLSIGRNEYGDQTSIHIGEDQAYHRLTLEAAGKVHTIEKIVKNKNSKEEGTTTLVNGEEIDRAGFEEFYNKEMGVPHPSIWLPLLVSMQNETDFYLRSKKSLREEALRAACQLTKLDNWKEALAAKTNEESKKINEELSALEALFVAKEQELKNLVSSYENLKKALGELESFTDKDQQIYRLEDILKNVTEFENGRVDLERAILEKTNQEREIGLATEHMKRLDKALGDLEDLLSQDWEEKLELIQAEIGLRSVTNAEKSLKAAENSLREIDLVLEKNPKLPPPHLLTEMVSLGARLASLIQKNENKESLLKDTLTKVRTLSNLNKEIEVKDIESALSRLEQMITSLWQVSKRFEELNSQKRVLEKHISELQDLKIDSKPQEEESWPGKPISEEEVNSLSARLLKHWGSNETCPLCAQNLKNLKHWSNPAIRQAMLEELKHKAQDNENQEYTKENRSYLLQHLNQQLQALKGKRLGLRREIKTSPLGELQTITSETEIDRLKDTYLQERNLLENALKHSQELYQLKKEVNDTLDQLESIYKTPTSIAWSAQQWCKMIEKWQEGGKAANYAQNEKNRLEKEILRLNAEILRLNQSQEPSENMRQKNQTFSDLDDLQLHNHMSQAHKKVKLWRDSFKSRLEKEKELSSAKTKLEICKASLQKIHNKIFNLNESLSCGCGIPIEIDKPEAPSLEYWETKASQWRKKENQTLNLKAKMEPLPAKIAAAKAELAELTQKLKETKKRHSQIAHARKVVSFLDYKHAPRKLLQNITEKLFAETNKIAGRLEADIQLSVGKNLEFLTQQRRAGKWIEQKSERLGFGKGAILGICFRLACQKMLLPETGFLILDEPTANVDQKRKSALKSFLQNLGEESSTNAKQIILVEHDTEVVDLCHTKIMVES